MSGSFDTSVVAARLGEVIESSTVGCLAESDRLHVLPELGQLVKSQISDNLISFGIVAFGATGSIDPGRRAVRRGNDALSDAAIYRQHPELDHVLRTTFRVAAVGFADGHNIQHALPPLPVPLHYSVHPCTADEIRRFCTTPRYFSALLNYRGEINPEDIVAAHLRWTDQQLNDDHQWIKGAARLLARLMKRDYDRLVLLLEAVDPESS